MRKSDERKIKASKRILLWHKKKTTTMRKSKCSRSSQFFDIRPSNPFVVRFTASTCCRMRDQTSFAWSQNSVGGSPGMSGKRFAKEWNETAVFVKPNAGPKSKCLNTNSRSSKVERKTRMDITLMCDRWCPFDATDHHWWTDVLIRSTVCSQSRDRAD